MYALVTLSIIGLTAGSNKSLDTRIVGGITARDGQYPYQVSLKIYTRHICSGSVIHERYILTAAHCIFGQRTEGLIVVAGTNYLNETGDEYYVEKLIFHEHYNRKTIANDIGLIRVQNHIRFSQKVQPIPLPYIYYVPDDATAVVSGWGLQSTAGSVSNSLQELYLNVMPLKECEEYYDTLSLNKVCAYSGRNEGVCNGDSGGPLVVNGVLVGIVSYGYPCALGFPDVYTRVFSYNEWINKTTNHGHCNGISFYSNKWIILLIFISTLLPSLPLFV